MNEKPRTSVRGFLMSLRPGHRNPIKNWRLRNATRCINRSGCSPAADGAATLNPHGRACGCGQSAGHDQVYGLWALTLFVRLNIEADSLTFVQSFQSGLLDRGDVDEHITPAVVRLNESVAPFAIEEFHDTSLCHRENSSPPLLRRRPHARRLGWTFTIGESVGPRRPQSTPPAPTGGGTSLPIRNYTPTMPRWKGATNSMCRGRTPDAEPVETETTLPLAPQSAGKSRQQGGKLAFQCPWRIDQNHAGTV
jgi:hypothetical protein